MVFDNFSSCCWMVLVQDAMYLGRKTLQTVELTETVAGTWNESLRITFSQSLTSQKRAKSNTFWHSGTSFAQLTTFSAKFRQPRVTHKVYNLGFRPRNSRNQDASRLLLLLERQRKIKEPKFIGRIACIYTNPVYENQNKQHFFFQGKEIQLSFATWEVTNWKIFLATWKFSLLEPNMPKKMKPNEPSRHVQTKLHVIKPIWTAVF